MFSYFAQIGEVNFLDCINAKYKLHPKMHKNFFIGKPHEGTPQVNEAAFKEIEGKLESARWQIHAVITDANPELTYSFYVANLCSEIYRLSMSLGLTEIYIELAQKSILVPITLDKHGFKELITVGTTTTELIAAYRYAQSFFNNLCDFAGVEAVNPHKDNNYRYMFEGKSYQTIKTPPVIERLHANEIQQALEEYKEKPNN